MKNSKNMAPDLQLRFATILSATLVLMYGIVPLVLELFDLYAVPYAEINFWYSLFLATTILTLPKKVPYIKKYIFFTQKNNMIFTVSVFFASILVFLLFPWIEDRDSVGASFSAIFRALWFVVGVSYITSPERTKLFIGIATVILMYIDQSRTYFFLLLVILAATSKNRYRILPVGLFFVTILAALRMDSFGQISDMLLYGIIGEGYNGTKAVGQIDQIRFISIDRLSHIVTTFLQPITLPFDVILSNIFDDYKMQDDFFGDVVSIYSSEKFNEMGGWFVIADFVYYGYFGIPLLWIYINITWYFSRFFFDTKFFPFGAFIFLISIKATPYIYWKFFYYVMFFSLIYNLVFSIKMKRQDVAGAAG
jgi:hypothetical protein